MMTKPLRDTQLLEEPTAADGRAAPGHDGEGGRVLIVDDLPANVRLLAGILKVAGYETVTAGSGAEALEKIAETPPDVVLLDIMMPGMDGFEVCRRIKANAATKFLPVVMVTALQDTSDRVQAIQVGANDFLTKPVDEVEVVSRVKSLVWLKRQRDALEQAYEDLKRVESMRDSLAMMLVHDLRTPLTTMIAPLEMLRKGQLGELQQTQQEAVEMCTRGGYRLLSLINELLDISKMESGEMKLERRDAAVAEVVQQAMDELGQLVRNHDIQINLDLDAPLPTVSVDDDLMRRVLTNLIGNAIKYSPRGGAVTITATTEEPGAVVIGVHDDGPGIPEEDQSRIFEKFGQVESRKEGRKMSTGLGLTFCKLAVEAHGGRIWVESTAGNGSTFKFTVPLATSDEVSD